MWLPLSVNQTTPFVVKFLLDIPLSLHTVWKCTWLSSNRKAIRGWLRPPLSEAVSAYRTPGFEPRGWRGWEVRSWVRLCLRDTKVAWLCLLLLLARSKVPRKKVWLADKTPVFDITPVPYHESVTPTHTPFFFYWGQFCLCSVWPTAAVTFRLAT